MSELENKFYRMWLQHNPDIKLLREVQAIPNRRFRFDFAHLETRVLIEIQGGTFYHKKLGHNTGKGLHRDYEKANLAQLQKWHLFYFDSKMFISNWFIGIGNFIRLEERRLKNQKEIKKN